MAKAAAHFDSETITLMKMGIDKRTRRSIEVHPTHWRKWLSD